MEHKSIAKILLISLVIITVVNLLNPIIKFQQAEQNVSRTKKEISNTTHDQSQNNTNNTFITSNTTHHHHQKKPYLILHVGPRKTGTTYMQHSIFAMNYDIFLKDNYHYLGKINKESFEKMPGEMDHYRFAVQYTTWGKWAKKEDHAKQLEWGKQRLKKELDRLLHLDDDDEEEKVEKVQLQHKNHNVIVSDETIQYLVKYLTKNPHDEELIKAFREMFDGYDVRTLIVYRRFHTWFISFYDFTNKLQWYEGNQMKNWPGISGRGGGKHISSVKEFYETEIKTPQVQGHRAVLSLKAFDRIFSNKNNSIVINMENLKEDELGKSVACSLPNTPHSCDFFTNDYKHETKVNAVSKDKKGKMRMDIEFHRMAQESHWENLIPTTYGRNQTFHLIKSFWRQNFTTTDDFYELYQQKGVPFECLDIEKENLLNITIEAEIEMYPFFFYRNKDTSSSATISSLQQHYIQSNITESLFKMNDFGYFCNIDVKELFQMDEWKAFFKQLSD